MRPWNQTASTVPMLPGMTLNFLDPADFLNRYAANEPASPCLRRLFTLLQPLEASAEFAHPVEWLEDLSAWLFQPVKIPGSCQDPTARLTLLLQVFDDIPEPLAALRAVVAQVFATMDGVRLFTDTGLPSRQAMFSEALGRIGTRLLPEPPVDGDLARLLFRLFPTRTAAHWFVGLPPAVSDRLFLALAVPSGAGLEPLRAAMRDAAVLLAVRIGAHGLTDAVRYRHNKSLQNSPFLMLPQVIHTWLADPSAGSDAEVQCRSCIAACRKATHDVVATLDQTGVSIDLVYRLELINRQLDRLYALVMVLALPAVAGAGTRLLQTLIHGGIEDRSLRNLFRISSRLLSRRIIERAGHGGEHYLTRTRAELHQMVRSAAGGGALVAVAVLLKVQILDAHLPLLFEGIFVTLNYSVAFVALQLAGFTLATKQPAMIAATLAGAIQDHRGGSEARPLDFHPLVELVARAFRSQLAAIVGNLGMVVPVALLINRLMQSLTGIGVMDPEHAAQVVHQHHPLLSASIPYALLSGVFLWMASILGGMVENWFVVHQLHNALASSRSLRAWGNGRAKQISDFFMNNISGFGGNVGFAILLGFAPMLGEMVGIPIEIRHVTFTTGQLAFAGMTLGARAVVQPDFLWAVSGIGVIGLCNFGMSFALALVVALRAREVGIREQLGLIRAVLCHFRTAPLDFFWAPRDPPVVLPGE